MHQKISNIYSLQYDIWSILLTYLNQYDLNRLVRLNKYFNQFQPFNKQLAKIKLFINRRCKIYLAEYILHDNKFNQISLLTEPILDFSNSIVFLITINQSYLPSNIQEGDVIVFKMDKLYSCLIGIYSQEKIYYLHYNCDRPDNYFKYDKFNPYYWSYININISIKVAFNDIIYSNFRGFKDNINYLYLNRHDICLNVYYPEIKCWILYRVIGFKKIFDILGVN